MRHWLVGVLGLVGAVSAGAKARLIERAPAPRAEWRLGAETVYLAGGGTGMQMLPGAGLAIFKSVPDSGFVFDAGFYVFPSDGGFFPIYFHPAYQFSPHWRLGGIVGGGLLAFEGSTLPVIGTAIEGEFTPVVGRRFQAGVLAGLPSAYLIFVVPPYFGTRLQFDVSPAVRLNAIVRLWTGAPFTMIGSLGMQVSL